MSACQPLRRAQIKPKDKAGKIVVEKSARALGVLGRDGKLLAYYPASIGSEEKPAPSGTHEVERVADNPSYTYNPTRARDRSPRPEAWRCKVLGADQ